MRFCATAVGGQRTRGRHGPLQKSVPVTKAALASFVKYRRDLLVNANRPAELYADAKAVGVEGGTPPHAARLAAWQCNALEAGDVAVHVDETLDVLFRHRVILLQARKGYRTNSDAMLLACRAAEIWNEVYGADASPNVVVDMCAGSGVVGISLGLRYPKSDILALELQPAFADRCYRNAILNGVSERMQVVKGNVSEVDLTRHHGAVDLLVCNPPYMPLGEPTRAPLNEERALARQESVATLDDFLRIAKALLHPVRGIAVFVYPQERRVRLDGALHRVGGFGSVRWTDVLRGGTSYDTPSATVLAAASVGAVLPSSEARALRLMHPVGSADVTAYAPWVERFFDRLGLP